MLSDGGGNVSSTRVVLVLFYSVVVAAWLFVTIKTKALADIPGGVTALGASLAALKWGQSRAEQ